jgi:hypothetical protein
VISQSVLLSLKSAGLVRWSLRFYPSTAPGYLRVDNFRGGREDVKETQRPVVGEDVIRRTSVWTPLYTSSRRERIQFSTGGDESHKLATLRAVFTIDCPQQQRQRQQSLQYSDTRHRLPDCQWLKIAVLMSHSVAQMLVHHTVGSCSTRFGHLMGSGTLSGTDPSTEGSRLEIRNGGKLSPSTRRWR